MLNWLKLKGPKSKQRQGVVISIMAGLETTMAGLDTREVVIELPERDVCLHVVKDVESLITDFNDPDRVPCWAEIWPAANIFKKYLAVIDFTGESSGFPVFQPQVGLKGFMD